MKSPFEPKDTKVFPPRAGAIHVGNRTDAAYFNAAFAAIQGCAVIVDSRVEVECLPQRIREPGTRKRGHAWLRIALQGPSCPMSTATISTVDEFDAWAMSTWGAPWRPKLWDGEVPRILENLEWSRCDAALKTRLAEVIMRESTSRCGALESNGDLPWFIWNFAQEIQVIDPPIDGRRQPAMKAALLLLAHQGAFTFSREDRESIGDVYYVFGEGGSALASIYLLSQLEYLFRCKGSYLDEDGKILKPIPTSLSSRAEFMGKKVNGRINRVDSAFLLYLEEQPDSLSVALAKLEADLAISERLHKIRNPTMHGQLGFNFAEGQFYALLLAMLYYSYPIDPNKSPFD